MKFRSIILTEGPFRAGEDGKWHIKARVAGLFLVLGPYDNIKYATMDYHKVKRDWRARCQ